MKYKKNNNNNPCGNITKIEHDTSRNFQQKYLAIGPVSLYPAIFIQKVP